MTKLERATKDVEDALNKLDGVECSKREYLDALEEIESLIAARMDATFEEIDQEEE